MTELTSADQRDLITRLQDLRARADELHNQMNDLKARIRAQLPAGDYTIDRKKVLTIVRQHRFDPTRAIQVLPPELLALCSVPKVDPATAKKVLPPALYSQCSVESGEPVIRLA